MSNEFVLGVKRSVLDDAKWGLSGKKSFSNNVKIFDIALSNAEFKMRGKIEDDPGFKQIIPYVMFITKKGKLKHVPDVFSYVRGGGSGEDRLLGKRSIGIGGHINKEDEVKLGMRETYFNGLIREINEEVLLKEKTYSMKPVAIINDDLTDVGKVHFGIVHKIIVADEDSVKCREAQIKNSKFINLGDLWKRNDELEVWSQLCLEFLLNE